MYAAALANLQQLSLNVWSLTPNGKFFAIRHFSSALPAYPVICTHKSNVHYTLCLKKTGEMTTSSTISWTRIVRLQQFLAHLLPIKSVGHLAIDRCFYFSITPISCTYFTLGCRDLNISKNWTKSWKFHRKMGFWLKISLCQSGMVHEGRCMSFPTEVGNLKASTVCWRESEKRVQ